MTVHGAVQDRLPDPIELAAYFVVSEALTNVTKHASATEASVTLDQERMLLRVTVTDDGVGGPESRPAPDWPASATDSMHSTGRSRSTAPTQGTTIRAELPCE